MFFQYFYSLTPATLFIGFIILISSPFLAMVALFFLTAGLVGGLGWAGFLFFRGVGRSVIRTRDERSERRRERTAPARASKRPYAYAVPPVGSPAPHLQRSIGSISAGGTGGSRVRPDIRRDRLS